jgi:hypothetical protein
MAGTRSSFDKTYHWLPVLMPAEMLDFPWFTSSRYAQHAGVKYSRTALVRRIVEGVYERLAVSEPHVEVLRGRLYSLLLDHLARIGVTVRVPNFHSTDAVWDRWDLSTSPATLTSKSLALVLEMIKALPTDSGILADALDPKDPEEDSTKEIIGGMLHSLMRFHSDQCHAVYAEQHASLCRLRTNQLG